MNTFKKLVTAIALSSLCVTYTTNATPIVNSWNFIVDTALTSSTLQSGGTATGSDTNAFWGAPTTLTWGIAAGFGLSSISVADGGTGNTVGAITTNGAAVHTAELIHDNNPIRGYSDSLVGAKLSMSLFLDPQTPAVPYGGIGGFFAPPLTFDIFFTETSNSGACVVSSPTPCSDIFVIDLVGGAGSTTFNPFTNTFNQAFQLFEHIYNAQILVSGLNTLSDPICSAAGASSGCIGITTRENFLNTFEVKQKISLVPEPSTLLLMSLALLGIAASSTRKESFTAS